MAHLVIDASIAATWCFKDEATSYTEGVLDAVSSQMEAIAPGLWAYEVRNSILTGMRRQRITRRDADDFLKSLLDLNITLADAVSYDDVFFTADRYKLTVYDAAYLDLAMKRGLPLATLDKELVRAAAHAGLPIFRP